MCFLSVLIRDFLRRSWTFHRAASYESYIVQTTISIMLVRPPVRPATPSPVRPSAVIHALGQTNSPTPTDGLLDVDCIVLYYSTLQTVDSKTMRVFITWQYRSEIIGRRIWHLIFRQPSVSLVRTLQYKFYNVSQKHPRNCSCNLSKHFPIWIIFWHKYYIEIRQSKGCLFSHLIWTFVCTTLQNRQTQKLRTCSTFTKSVMVSVAVS